jgi:hypothetical protein
MHVSAALDRSPSSHHSIEMSVAEHSRCLAAGFMLGAIPLVISALKHSAKGVETIQKWWRYQKELSSL